jgi:cytochrome P450
MRDAYRFYARIRARYGDLVTLPTVNGTVVLGCTPEYAREILQGREEDFEVGFALEAVTSLVGADSLLLLSGERHKRERKLMSPAFHGSRMRAYGPIAQRATQEAIAQWRPGSALTARPAMQRITLDVILRAVFGVQVAAEIEAFREAIRRAVLEVNPALVFFPMLQREVFGMGPWARFVQSKRALELLIQQQIDRARARREPSEDVLSRLVFARGEHGELLGDTALRAQLITLLLAGHETTATALSWALYELCRNPGWAERLRAQVDALGPEPDAASLAALPDLDAFCSETLRLHPILAEFFRTVRTSYSVGGYEIPAGLHVAGAILAIHQNESLYPEPSVFRPERFLERRFGPHEFAAFGGGHRHCLGAAFAMNEMKVVLGTLLSRVRFRLAHPRPLGVARWNVTLAPEGDVPLVVEEKR